MASEIMNQGTVVRVELEGGFWGIRTTGGDKLFPLDLPEAFREDGLDIEFQAEPAMAFTAAQWGKTVRVSNVRRLA